jgi:GT2 family glycosyltransferase
VTSEPDSAGMPNAAVVICAYSDERWNDLRAAVASVREQSQQPTQTIVVIDHNEALLLRAKSELFGCFVVANRYESGLSGARNTGLEVASEEIVAFLDDDARAEPDWLARLCAPYRDPHVLAVGGAASPNWDARRPRWFPAEFDWVIGCSYVGLPVTLTSVRNVMGCSMSFRRSIVSEVGGFRSDLGRIGKTPLGCEETELCIRARQAFPSGTVLFEPRALVHHRVPTARGRFRYFLARCRAEGLSKARVSTVVGAGDGLSSERAYVRSVLPHGVGRALASTSRRDMAGVPRAGAIVAGLATVTFGYVQGRLVARNRV